MEPLEVAMKLASASASCEKHKCPFMSQCKGDYSTCAMKEIALTIRSQDAEIKHLTDKVNAFNNVVTPILQYIIELEKVNKRYHDIIVAFQQGYRPKANRYKPKRLPKKKKDPVEMDGDERYAQSPPQKEKPQKVRVI